MCICAYGVYNTQTNMPEKEPEIPFKDLPANDRITAYDHYISGGHMVFTNLAETLRVDPENTLTLSTLLTDLRKQNAVEFNFESLENFVESPETLVYVATLTGGAEQDWNNTFVPAVVFARFVGESIIIDKAYAFPNSKNHEKGGVAITACCAAIERDYSGSEFDTIEISSEALENPNTFVNFVKYPQTISSDNVTRVDGRIKKQKLRAIADVLINEGFSFDEQHRTMSKRI